jgi:WD40 repeat protein
MDVIVLQGHDRPVNVVRITTPGDLFFTGSAGSKVNLWKTYTGERLGSYTTKASVKSLDISADHQLMVCCSLSGSVEVFSVATGVSLCSHNFPSKKVKYLEFSQGGEEILFLLEDYKNNNSILVYRFKDFFAQLKNGTIGEPTVNIPLSKIVLKASWRILNEGFTICTIDGQL